MFVAFLKKKNQKIPYFYIYIHFESQAKMNAFKQIIKNVMDHEKW